MRTLQDLKGRPLNVGDPAAGRFYAVVSHTSILRYTRVASSVARAGRVDIHMELAGASYTVRVDGTIERQAAEISQTIGEEGVDNLPSVTRSVTKYALLDPHVRQAIGLGADPSRQVQLSLRLVF